MHKQVVISLLVVSSVFLTACSLLPNSTEESKGSEDKVRIEEPREDLVPDETAPATEVVVKVTDAGYEPAKITVKKGDTVKWINETKDKAWVASAFHPTHEVYPEFDQKTGMGMGESWSFTFDQVGEWKYHDHLVPTKFGSVTVTE